MSAIKVQVIGGHFVDAEGNAIANGYLEFVLSQDATVPGVNLVGAGRKIKIQLDSNGNAVTSPAQYLWGNDVLQPLNTYYRVTGFTAQGQPVWGPNNQQIVGSGTFDLGTWVPNQVFSWTPSPQPLVLETDGVENGSQTKLNLVAGTGMTLTDDGSGDVTVASTVVGLSTSANVGDTLRYNEFGNSAWDEVSGLPNNFIYTTPNRSGGFSSSGLLIGGTSGGISPQTYVAGTATESPFGRLTTSLSTASSNVIMALGVASDGASVWLSLGSIRRWTARYRLSTTANNIRFWSGLTSLAAVATTPSNMLFATNTPNNNYAAFRYAAGTDTHWQAVCGTNSSNQTVIDTGVTPDTTNSQLLEIIPTASGFLFYINGTQVANITTHTPALSTNVQSFWTVDNQNNAHGYNLDWWYTNMTMK